MKIFHPFFCRVLGCGRTMSCLSGQSNKYYHTSPRQLRWSVIMLVFLMRAQLMPALRRLLKISLILKSQENKQNRFLWLSFALLCKCMILLKSPRYFCVGFDGLAGDGTLRDTPASEWREDGEAPDVEVLPSSECSTAPSLPVLLPRGPLTLSKSRWRLQRGESANPAD